MWTTVASLRQAGVVVLRDPADMPWGERLGYVADPDGNPVALVAPLGDATHACPTSSVDRRRPALVPRPIERCGGCRWCRPQASTTAEALDGFVAEGEDDGDRVGAATFVIDGGSGRS